MYLFYFTLYHITEDNHTVLKIGQTFKKPSLNYYSVKFQKKINQQKILSINVVQTSSLWTVPLFEKKNVPLYVHGNKAVSTRNATKDLRVSYPVSVVETFV
jgi:hypothetical protein